jgi:hypothetical protein
MILVKCNAIVHAALMCNVALHKVLLLPKNTSKKDQQVKLTCRHVSQLSFASLPVLILLFVHICSCRYMCKSITGRNSLWFIS